MCNAVVDSETATCTCSVPGITAFTPSCVSETLMIDGYLSLPGVYSKAPHFARLPAGRVGPGTPTRRFFDYPFIREPCCCLPAFFGFCVPYCSGTYSIVCRVSIEAGTKDFVMKPRSWGNSCFLSVLREETAERTLSCRNESHNCINAYGYCVIVYVIAAL